MVRNLHNTQSYNSGFTLIEVLIAVAVFGLMAVMAYSGLNNSMNISHAVQQRSNELHRMQIAMAFIQRDFTQLINQPIRDEFGDTQPALFTDTTGERLLELSRSGWRNPANQIRSTLQRVGYRFEENRLYREYWPHFNRGPGELPLSVMLLDSIADVRFEFMDNNQQWHKQWPPLNTPAGGLPVAVKIAVFPLREGKENRRTEEDDDNRIERFFDIPPSS